MKQYQVTALGRFQIIHTVKRRYPVQTLGRLAAISVPTAEMTRLWNECKGNLETVLGPMRDALRDQGFTDLFILPAQTVLVELRPIKGLPPAPEEDRSEELLKRVTQLAKELMDTLPENMNSAQRVAAMKLSRALDEINVETWTP